VKIAFDENLPPMMVGIFQKLAKQEKLPVVIVSARRYRPRSERGDQNWIRRFAKAGGKVIISGDARMRSNLHEQAALTQAGMITFFFEYKWNTSNFYVKCAMLFNWWPRIIEVAGQSTPGDFWEVPHQWNWKDMRNVRPQGDLIAKITTKGT
jgi:hypothetical protein